MNFCYYGFKGAYGGDRYEEWFCTDFLKELNINMIREPRFGGVKSLSSLLVLFLRFYKKELQCQNVIFRPFGIPLYKRKMNVFVHHFDQSFSPWYTTVLEYLDWCILKVFGSYLQIRVIVVSEYWGNFIRVRLTERVCVVYNIPNTELGIVKNRSELSQHYGLDEKKEWIFLGAHEEKKGGLRLLRKLKNRGNLHEKNLFLMTGKNSEDMEMYSVRWLDRADYLSFLSNCNLVIANSLFKEGWCRVVHEAALLNIPVYGSGFGGMGELFNDIYGRKSFNEDELIDIIEGKLSGPVIKDFSNKLYLERNQVVKKLLLHEYS